METENLPVTTPEAPPTSPASSVVERLNKIVNLVADEAPVTEEKTDAPADEPQKDEETPLQPATDPATEDGTSAPESKEVEPESKPLPDSWGEGVKTAKFKHGDKEFTVPEDAVFEMKIDGKLETVDLGKLKANYSGKTVWQKHFADLKVKTREVQAKETELTARQEADRARINGFLAKSKTNPFEAQLEYLIDSGADAESIASFVKPYFNQIRATADSMAKMTPAEVEARILAIVTGAQQKALKKQQTEFETQRKYSEENQQLAQFIGTKQKQLGVSDEEMQMAVEIVTDTEGFASKSNKEKVDELFRFIEDFHRPFQRIEKVVSEVAPELVAHDKFQRALFDVTKGAKDLTDVQLKQIVKSYIRSLAPGSNGAAPTPQKPETRNGTTAPAKNGTTPTPVTPVAETKAEEDDLGPFSARDLRRKYG